MHITKGCLRKCVHFLPQTLLLLYCAKYGIDRKLYSVHRLTIQSCSRISRLRMPRPWRAKCATRSTRLTPATALCTTMTRWLLFLHSITKGVTALATNDAHSRTSPCRGIVGVRVQCRVKWRKYRWGGPTSGATVFMARRKICRYKAGGFATFTLCSGYVRLSSQHC